MNGNGNTAAQFRDVVGGHGTALHVTVVDLGTIRAQPNVLRVNSALDYFRPNDWGHQLIAQTILAVV